MLTRSRGQTTDVFKHLPAQVGRGTPLNKQLRMLMREDSADLKREMMQLREQIAACAYGCPGDAARPSRP